LSVLMTFLSPVMNWRHHLPPFLSSLAILLAAALLGWLAYGVLVQALERWGNRILLTRHKVRLRLEPLRGALRLLLIGAAISLALPLLRLPAGIQQDLSHLVRLWVIAATAWLMIRLVRVAVAVGISYHQINVPNNLHARQLATQLIIIGRIVSAAILVLAVATMLMTFANLRHIGISVLTSAGVMGIVLGLAAQKTLGNVIAGIQIAFAQPIRLDDVVIVEGEWGRVEEITLTYVVVRIWDLRRLVLPISYFVERPFQNWTRVSADLIGTVYLFADYTLPVAEVRAELERILAATDLWDGKVQNLQVTDVSERTMQLRALMSAPDSSTAWNLRCHVRERLLDFLQRRFPEHLPRTRVDLEPETAEGQTG
jgi:small-conductance mechanosensitive channel